MSTDLIFNIVIAFIFAYEAFVLFTKKNGGSQRMADQYTEESLKKFSILSGVLMIFLTIFEVMIILSK